MAATHEQKYRQSEIVAELAKLTDSLDLVVLGEMLSELDQYDTVMPILNPTRWRLDHNAMADTAKLMRSAYDLARTFRTSKAKAPEYNAERLSEVQRILGG